jgi:hypothetical protein
MGYFPYVDEINNGSRETWELTTYFISMSKYIGEKYYLVEMNRHGWKPDKDVGILWRLVPSTPDIKIRGEVNGELLDVRLNGSNSVDNDGGEITKYIWSIYNVDQEYDILHLSGEVNGTSINSTGLMNVELYLENNQGLNSSETDQFLVLKQGKEMTINFSDCLLKKGCENWEEIFNDIIWYLDGKRISNGTTLNISVVDPGVFDLSIKNEYGDECYSKSVYVIEDPEFKAPIQKQDDFPIGYLIALSLIILLIVFSILTAIKKLYRR